jgi:hypothetical protein
MKGRSGSSWRCQALERGTAFAFPVIAAAVRGDRTLGPTCGWSLDLAMLASHGHGHDVEPGEALAAHVEAHKLCVQAKVHVCYRPR